MIRVFDDILEDRKCDRCFPRSVDSVKKKYRWLQFALAEDPVQDTPEDLHPGATMTWVLAAILRSGLWCFQENVV
jgi:hypothetical protein